jgi:phosphatidate cytidylyltransferase
MSALPPIERMAIVVGAILLIATIAQWILRIAKPGRDFRELTARIYAWWWMSAIVFGAALADWRVALVFFAFLSFWAVKEFITLLHTRPADHKALVLMILAIPVQYYWIGTAWYGMFIIFIPVYMFLIIPIRLMLSEETTGFVSSASQIQWGLMAFVFGLSHIAYLRMMPPGAGTTADGRSLLLFLIFVVEISDVMQYVWGKSIGRHPVLPRVSPNKTWEGLIGGIATTVGLSLLVRFLTPFTISETIAVSLLITIAGFFGGAVMSAVKRDFGVKDFGTLIPGHGGMLDRIDSLCYAAPVFFHFVRYYHSTLGKIT